MVEINLAHPLGVLGTENMADSLDWIPGFTGTLVSIFLFVLAVAVVLRAITRPHRTPTSRVAWVAVILFVPLLGVIAYFLLGETSIGRERVRKLKAAEAHLQLPTDQEHALVGLSSDHVALFDLIQSINGFAPVKGNSVELAANSDAAIDGLVADIAAAQESIHISFYIWLDDTNGGKVVEAICAAAQRGIMCRVMVDALGSRAFVRGHRWAQMRDAGAHLAVALNDIHRAGNFALGRVDLRNHRKIVVIDNSISYVGSQNCADPAFRTKPKFAPWEDIFFRCEGPLVRQEQWLFLTEWEAETGEILASDFTRARPVAEIPDGIVGAMFGTGPTSRAGAMSEVFVASIYAARNELTISTPYFVPDSAMLSALCAAPRRGVKTTLIVPKRNDSWFVGAAAHSNYEALLEAGVELYEYLPGLLHSKSLCADGQITLVGSANMDRRSLDLNYENNLLAIGAEITGTMRERQQIYIDASRQVHLEEVRDWPFSHRLVQNAVGMLAPIL